ncbi:MAG: NAD(P)/FAD-dependent oxidoreductase, partial [Clostridiales bacterium]|nr:NAD(P)/FAD-dependent oxidoreductase [Clostridiales bacterium]
AYPALAPIETSTERTKALSGLRVKGTASIERGGKTVSSRAGEILFASGRLSGIAIMDLAIYARELPCDVCIDLMPGMGEREVADFLKERAAKLSDLLAEHFFIGCFQRMLGQVIIKSAGVEASMPVSQLGCGHMEALARQIKRMRFPVLSVSGFKSAQATLGGAATSGFCPDTCESLSVKGLFAAGEVLDICGDCGGFNLQWAWSSGWVAGRAAAKDVLQNRK